MRAGDAVANWLFLGRQLVVYELRRAALGSFLLGLGHLVGESGSVCRHLKIAGRIAFFMISSGYQPPPAKVATQPNTNMVFSDKFAFRVQWHGSRRPGSEDDLWVWHSCRTCSLRKGVGGAT